MCKMKFSKLASAVVSAVFLITSTVSAAPLSYTLRPLSTAKGNGLILERKIEIPVAWALYIIHYLY